MADRYLVVKEETVKVLVVNKQGPAGVSAVAGQLPNSYVETDTPQGTTSATLEDVTGMSTTVTLEGTAQIAVIASFQLSTQAGASASTIALAVSINGTDHDETQRYLSGSNDVGIGCIVHRSVAALAAGTYTVKLRMRRVSGVSTPGIDRADMLVMALQGAKGDTGANGGTDIVLDTTPQLGGNLDMNGKNIQGVTPTEMAYLSGLSSALQTQLNAKLAHTGGTITNYNETTYYHTTTGDITISLSNGNSQRITLDAARQITLPADPGAVTAPLTLIIECATFTPTWNTSPTIEWLTSDGAAPTLVTTANLVNVLTFIWDDVDSRWLGFLAGKETA